MFPGKNHKRRSKNRYCFTGRRELFQSVTIFILVLFIPNIVLSQSFYSKHFTKDDGLPGLEVYDLIQDRTGYIWMATSYGVCRYDGYDFKTFTTNDGLADNSIITLKEDFRGRIWASSYSGDISYFEDGRFWIHPANNEIKKYTQGFVELYVDRANNLHFTPLPMPMGNVTVTASNNIIINKIENEDSLSANYTICFTPTSDNITWKSLKGGKDREIVKNEIEKVGDTYYLKFRKYSTGNYLKYFMISETEFLISYENWLFHLKDDRIIAQKYFESRVNDVYVDNRAAFWISVSNHGVLYYNNSDLQSEPYIFLPGIAVSNVIQDNDENYWIATNGDGVVVVPSLEFQFLDHPEVRNEKIVSLRAYRQQLYFSTMNRKMFRYDYQNNSLERIDRLFFNQEPGICNDILVDSKEQIWVLGTNELCFTLDGDPVPVENEEFGFQIIELQNKQIALASYFRLNLYENNKRIYTSLDHDMQIRLRSVFEDNKGVLWLGTLDGLYKFYNNEYEYFGERCSALSGRITVINGRDELLVVGTKGNGLVMVNRDECYLINEKNGIRGNNIQSLLFENNSSLWIGSNNGLSNLYFNIEDSFIYRIRNFTKWDGLTSNNITGIAQIDRNLILGTEKGVVFLNPERVKENLLPPGITIEKIQVNHVDTTVCDSFNLKHFQNSLRIGFKGLSFKSIGDIRYKYQFAGLSEQFTYTKNPQVEFAMVPPGDYQFIVYAQNINGIWSQSPAKITFHIKYPFWKQLWFVVLSIVVLLVSGFIIIRMVIRNINRKNKREQDLIHYHQQALSKQLDPHFLYNSLNSIQRFILENDKISSSQYLSKFSGLMRIVLEMSNKQLVTLNEETQALNLYLELESMRLKNSFSYAMEIDPAIDKINTQIPSFIIQPFVENAIWHGLAHNQANNRLEIAMSYSNGFIICRVKDNGKGIDLTVLESKDHSESKKSFGIKNTQKRLDLINKQFNTNSHFKISNLIDTNEKQAEGVEVVIWLSEMNKADVKL